MKKRIALLIAFVLFLVGSVACTKKCEHVDANDDKKCDLCQKPFDDGLNGPYQFKTPVTDSITLNESYEGKDFFDDGIGKATVVAFTDGDTAIFKTEAGRKVTVRFLGIDTPESTYKVEPWGFAASTYTKNALKNANTIVLQAETLDESKRVDSSGNRYLAWVWVDGRLLNLEIAEVGLAAAKAEGTRYASEFIRAIQPIMLAKERIYGTKNDPNYDYTSFRQEYSIKQLRAEYGTPESIGVQKDAGKKIKITGTVTKVFGSSSAYIQQYDEDGNYYGIYVYGGYEEITAFSEGTTITINGTVGYYYGQLQITSVTNKSIKVWSYEDKENVVPIEMELKDISIDNYNSIGNLITINEELVIKSSYESEETYAFTLTAESANGTRIDIRVDKSVALVDENGERIVNGDQLVGKTITSLTGILSYYDPNFGSQSPELYDGRIQIMWGVYSDVIFK